MPKSVKKKPKINRKIVRKHRKIVRKLANAISELRADEADAAGEAEMFEEALEHYEKTGQIRREVRESYWSSNMLKSILLEILHVAILLPIFPAFFLIWAIGLFQSPKEFWTMFWTFEFCNRLGPPRRMT